jgi:ABC-type polysaccharide/polyol phosphate transport system ATPase subunit
MIAENSSLSRVCVEDLCVTYKSPKFAGTVLSQPDGAQADMLWSLQGVSFTVEPGHAFALVGVNGSGKSTVLKALAGVVPCTSKKLIMPEKTLCALDLNLFFHHDFSGFDNLYMMNACFGRKDSELEPQLENILRFSELGDFIHRPVREYSTGMRMRLGVSYILHQEFDCLLIDEILSVGDAAFQRKCHSRIKNILAFGKSVVISSHNLDEVAGLCDGLMILVEGRVFRQGRVEDVISSYFQMLDAKVAGEKMIFEHKRPVHEVQGVLEIKNVRFLNAGGEDAIHFPAGSSMKIEITVEIFKHRVTKPLVRVEFYRNDNLFVSGNNNYRKQIFFDLQKGEATIVFDIESLNMVAATYYISVSFWPDEFTSFVTREPYDFHEKRYELTVSSDRTQGAGISYLPGSFYVKSS